MYDFPPFMKNEKNKIDATSQFTDDIEGYVYDGADGSQMAFWTCKKDRASEEHIHDFDEYTVVVKGCAILTLDGEKHVLHAGDEIYMPKGTRITCEVTAGTRTIHAFGGKRAERVHQI